MRAEKEGQIGRITGKSDPEAEGEALGADIAGGGAEEAAGRSIRQWRSDCRSESCKRGGGRLAIWRLEFENPKNGY
ncbi:hypothetical protein C2S52_009288 [Perilla frutescens var. hirtella]|nr:hypothetical protein C2S51_017211 [Perilla frutescens var. frutescens]KAH6784329.1 hypothetical protein C2S52_009288 [Perilla frutescens var. hirtella]